MSIKYFFFFSYRKKAIIAVGEFSKGLAFSFFCKEILENSTLSNSFLYNKHYDSFFFEP